MNLLGEIIAGKNANNVKGLLPMYVAMNKSMAAKRFDEVNHMLAHIDPEDFSLTACVGIARFLYAGSYELSNWSSYVSRVHDRMLKMDQDKNPNGVLRGLIKPLLPKVN